MIATAGSHQADCLCVPCMMRDMDQTLRANGLNPAAYKGHGVTAEQTKPSGNPNTSTARPAKPATEKQLSFIQSLLRDRETAEAPTLETLSSKAASALIDKLLGCSKKVRTQPAAPAKPAVRHAERPALEAGMHLKDGVVYKVQRAVHGSGSLYAKRLTDDGFEYAPGAVRTLTAEDRMTLEQAKQYGALYGQCACCGRQLTDEESIANGIGPICAKKF